MTSKTITTTCTRDCPNTCGLVATVEDGIITRLHGSPDHPLTRGLSCHKTSRYLKRVYSDERVTTPMIRKGSEWHEASWNEVLDLIAGKMKTICRESGPEGILYYQGYGERTALKLLNGYFFNLLGGVTTLRGSLCGGTGQASQNLDFGRRISHDPLDHQNSKAMILWARNPASTNMSLVPIARKIRKNGGRVITIDPYKNRSSAFSDRHISPAPGKDIWLAMACAKSILDQGQADDDFLENNSVGFEAYKELLAQKSITELAHLAEVNVEDINYLAQTLTEFKPTSILLGWGLHRHKDAHFSIRAIDALAAIAGIIGIPGGGVSQGFEEYGPYDQQYWGTELNPPRRTLLMPSIGQEILDADKPKIRMIFTTASNPVCMAANSNLVAKAFRETEFVVYSGHCIDDTADLADVFLPATTFLEENDVMASYGHNYVGPVNKVIDPIGDCLTDYQMFAKLADRFDFKDLFCRAESDWLNDICAPIFGYGCSMEELKTGPFRIPEPMVPYLDRVFPTPSGKFQFMTQIDEQRIDNRQPGFPLKLLTVAAHDFICSERTINDHTPFPQVLLHPETAAKSGIKDNTVVRIESPSGTIKGLVQTTTDARPDCLVTERGGWIKAGHGLNILTADGASTIGAGTPYYETCVRISVIEED
ncbi:molybdopterin-dependent oxidoreductase [Desulfosediminicola sp.]|uniref:molybdopterin-dependent oxidoreductase n=1 Tax=Desulfosediminicola sp. TaxID=2886825 RepID=UPI003AF2180B